MTSSNRRERELARAKFERQQARRAEQQDKARARQRVIAVVVIAALLIAGGGWAVFSLVGSQDSSTAANQLDETVTSLAEEIQAQGPLLEICGEPVASRSDDISFEAAPDPSSASSGSVTLSTNCGDIVIELFAEDAPATVASIGFLADQGFYDATACHRLTTAGIFVLQCGDPAGNGTGGPGYLLPDENLPAEELANYPAGTVAMANAGPGTAGSQFFIVYGDTTLPSGYTIWGQVTQGLDVVQAIAEAGTADGSGDGLPAQPIVIESATVTAAG
jgi:peptidyl-prolyl cis-trans isomerase B (cyclophilin B)